MVTGDSVRLSHRRDVEDAVPYEYGYTIPLSQKMKPSRMKMPRVTKPTARVSVVS
jgi:hypothetical protein